MSFKFDPQQEARLSKLRVIIIHPYHHILFIKLPPSMTSFFIYRLATQDPGLLRIQLKNKVGLMSLQIKNKKKSG
jgi:hypothetical protein